MKRCRHDRIRTIYGDRINAVNGDRSECVACGATLPDFAESRAALDAPRGEVATKCADAWTAYREVKAAYDSYTRESDHQAYCAILRKHGYDESWSYTAVSAFIDHLLAVATDLGPDPFHSTPGATS